MSDEDDPDGEIEVVGVVYEPDEDDLDGELDEDLDDLDEVPLSDALEQILTTFILIENGELAVSRAETLDFLIDTLRDLEEDEDLEAWVAAYGSKDFHLSQERDGRLIFSDVFPVSGVLGYIPKAVMSGLSAELLGQDEDDREGWLETLSDLIAEWFLLLTDEEKMVGHLIRAHGLSVENTASEHDALVGAHAELHAGVDDEDDVEDDDIEDPDVE
jgi:hypothetical protein